MKNLITLIFATLIGTSAMAATPEPTYQTLTQSGEFEVRAYTPQLAADVTLTGTDASMNQAFRILANYIFKEYPTGKIGMTAPVTVATPQAIGMTAPVTVSEEHNRVFMRFYLPERYTLKTIPQPADKRIGLIEIPARKVAVITFNGWLSPAKNLKKEAKLREWLASQNLSTTGPAEVQGYNPPWTLPWWRRNEIWLPIQ